MFALKITLILYAYLYNPSLDFNDDNIKVTPTYCSTNNNISVLKMWERKAIFLKIWIT